MPEIIIGCGLIVMALHPKARTYWGFGGKKPGDPEIDTTVGRIIFVGLGLVTILLGVQSVYRH